jgi:hypothetical protein
MRIGFVCLILIIGLRSFLHSAPQILSESGSGRATAYLESSKIVQFEERVHVAWLDSSEDGFKVRIRTLDRTTGEWSTTYTIGDAANNHGGPALTVDGAGYLHVVYYAHHHPVRYRRSIRPNDASEWGPIEHFGKDLTYPALICLPDDSLVFIARRSYEDRPWEVELWRREDAAWQREGPIIRSRYPGYAQFAASMVWDAQREKLHFGTRIYETINDNTQTPYTTIGYLSSNDGGRTWYKSNAEEVTLPVTALTIDRVASADGSLGRVLSGGSVAVHPNGTPYLVYNERLQAVSHAYLARPDTSVWHHDYLNPFLPEAVKDYSVYFYGGLSFAESGGLLMAGTLMKLSHDALAWGDPTMEVVIFHGNPDTGTFSGELILPPNPAVPRWLPSIERPVGNNGIDDWPAVIFMEGERGAALDDQLNNTVWWYDLDTSSSQ